MGASGAVVERGRRRGGAVAPAVASRTTWALMPPKPNALTPARRGRSPHGAAASITRKRVVASSARGCSQCSDGGWTSWCNASAALIKPATPAAGMAWPIIDFTEPSPGAGPLAGPPKNCASAASSTASPVGVAVPWASISPTVAGSQPASRHAWSSAASWPASRGRIGLDSLPSLVTPVPRMTA